MGFSVPLKPQKETLIPNRYSQAVTIFFAHLQQDSMGSDADESILRSKYPSGRASGRRYCRQYSKNSSRPVASEAQQLVPVQLPDPQLLQLLLSSLPLMQDPGLSVPVSSDRVVRSKLFLRRNISIQYRHTCHEANESSTIVKHKHHEGQSIKEKFLQLQFNPKTYFFLYRKYRCWLSFTWYGFMLHRNCLLWSLHLLLQRHMAGGPFFEKERAPPACKSM